MKRRSRSPIDRVQAASFLINTICDASNPTESFRNAAREFRRNGLSQAVLLHDNERLFNWLMDTLSFQGVSDQAASTIIARDGNVTWQALEASLGSASCAKLEGFWRFTECRFQKAAFTCSQPDHLPSCPLPRHRLRNGHLNQLAYSLYFFIRDVAEGDLVGWIGAMLDHYGSTSTTAYLEILDSLKSIYGASDKVLSMALSSLFIGAGRVRPNWKRLGQNTLVIDTLVHKFLHRTGLCHEFGQPHAYGPACYATKGCADVIASVAGLVDCRRFHPSFPKLFPRFVQNAVWRFCAVSELNICNSNKIDDTSRCANRACPVWGACTRRPVKSAKTAA